MVSHKLYLSACLAFFLVGGILRLTSLSSRSLWLDEAALANFATQTNIGTALSHPHVAMPAPLFVVLLHFLAKSFGASELVLRVLPYLAGTLSLFLIYLIARHLFNRSTALISLFLLAFSSFCIYYSQELKQYSTEMLFNLLLVYSALKLLSGKAVWKDLLSFSLVSVTGVLISHTFIFIYPPVALLLLIRGRRQRRQWSSGLIVISGIVIVLFLGTYFLYTSHTATTGLSSFWKAHYVKSSSWNNFWRWNLNTINSLNWTFFNGLYFPLSEAAFSSLVLFFFGLGIFYLVRKQRWNYLLLLLGPLLLLYLAAALRRYPLAPRLVLFVLPLPVITVASGISRLLGIFAKRRIARVLLLLLFTAGVFFYLEDPVKTYLFSPIKKEELRPVLRKVRQVYQPDDAVYVYYGAVTAFKFYWPLGEDTYHPGRSHRHRLHRYRPEIKQFLSKNLSRRAWFIFSHYGRKKDKRKIILEAAGRDRKLVMKFEDTGASAYLFAPAAR